MSETRQEINKQIVREFYDCVVNTKDFEAAKKYLAPRYIQHNPNDPDGHDGLRQFITKRKAEHPDQKSEIIRIFAEGDYVILHVRSLWPPDTYRAIVEIYRLENGLVAEHWDVMQFVPATCANPNGMF
jgi:predicted SnoaL-like aldol condensation-catalyzing enzyme